MWGPRGHLGLIALAAAFMTMALMIAAFDDAPFAPSAGLQAALTAALAVWAAIAATSK